MKIVAFDVLGPMYHYNGKQGWNPEKGALPTLCKHISRLGYDCNTIEQEAAAEEDILQKGLVEVSITPSFVESVLQTYKEGALPIIISAGTKPGFAYSLEAACKDYHKRTGNLITPKQLFSEEHRHSTISRGSKKSPDTWKNIASGYEGDDVVVVYEDTFKNMMAAMIGLDCRGFYVVPLPSGIITFEKRIVKGTMKELQKPLEEILR